ncbi:hypothetical protein ACQ4M3_29065 [Leptolyngbya sp. AN03gr2]|uniref:hypothetical protein n=1 Tax=unclassified Leptolyngbya TaxID=2650499 RepID=UPI003D30F8F2
MVNVFSPAIITASAPTQPQTQLPTQPAIQSFNPIWSVRERYLSPRSLRFLDKRDLFVWGHKPLGEFLMFVDKLSEEEQDQRFNRALCCITDKSLREWAAKLKLPSEERRGGYQAKEVELLDDYYQALHFLGMSFSDFNEKVVREGKTLAQYLNEGI